MKIKILKDIPSMFVKGGEYGDMGEYKNRS